MKINLLILLALVSLVWGTIGYGFDALLHFHMLSLIPCLGLGLILWYAVKMFIFALRAEIQNRGTLRKTMNMAVNILLVISHRVNSEKALDRYDTIAKFSIDPKEFRRKMGL